MLGQKIVDSFADFDGAECPQSLSPEPPCGLTVRRIKSAGLRIITEGDTLWSDSHKATGSSLCPPTGRNSYLSIRTPDTSCTFGRPNPTMRSPKHPPSASISTPPSSAYPLTAVLAARRFSRYSQAESQLRSAVEVSSAEISPQELQIRALEKATTMLSEQARDAQASAAKLRAYIAHGDSRLSPEELRSLQRDCWLEERRSTARQDQSTHMRNLLTKLCSPISEVSPPFVESPTTMSRREANLVKFMQLSPTRVSYSSHGRSVSTSFTLTRRQTISQVRPLRLRASALELALRSPVQTRPRSRSLNGSTHSRRTSDSTDVTLVSPSLSDQASSEGHGNVLRLKLPSSLSAIAPDGLIRIEKPEKFHGPQFLESGDVSLPEYAISLLEDLAADVTLPTLSPSLTILASEPHASTPHEPHPRISLSFPDFTHFDEPDTPVFLSSPLPSPSSPPSRSPPTSSSIRPPYTILGRLRSQSDTPSVLSPSSSLRLRQPTPNSHLRASATQSLHFSSLRSPSLVTVPEADVDLEQRPQSSLSNYMYAPSPAEEEHETEANAGRSSRGGLRRRLSQMSFRRRRFNSEGGGLDVEARAAAIVGAPADVRRTGPNATGSHEHGLIARFKRRLTGQK